MEMITINDIEYYNSEDVFNKAPIYCKDCRNGRELIKNKKINGMYLMVKVTNMIKF